MNKQDDFWQEEIAQITQQKQLFAKSFPQAAQFLTEKSHDPDVDRTLDGANYAFHVLNQKLKQQYPHLTYGLVDTLWQNYLQPTPSMTIIEFTTKHADVTSIAKGSELKSRPRTDGTWCTFQTARDTEVLP